MVDGHVVSRPSSVVPAHTCVTFDEALTKHVGQFGPGQWRILAASSLCLVANAAAFFWWVFSTQNPVSGHLWACVDPSDSTCAAVKAQASPSKQDFCALPAGSTQWTSQDSLVAKFNLVCGDAWKVQFTNSLMFMGAFLGSGTFGFLCDRWGRKKPLFLATAVIAASMYASLAAPSYWVMAALRAVTGFGAAGQSHCNFLCATESVGPAYRGLANICALCFFIAGEFIMVALGYALPSWQHLLIACASLNAGVLLLYPLVPESARWLLSKGRIEEATALLQRIAKANGSRLPPQELVSSRSSNTDRQQTPASTDLEAAQIQTPASLLATRSSFLSPRSSTHSEPQAAAKPVGLLQLLRQRRMAIRLSVLLLTCFSMMSMYYMISLGAGGIPGSIYTTFAFGAAAEVVAVCTVAPTVDRLGRHNIVALGQLLGGSACLAVAMVGNSATAQAALAAVGKFGCSAASSVSSIYIAELLPTSCRSSVMGVCSQASRLGSITAPFLLMLGAQLPIPGHSQVFIPFTTFGCLAILSGLLVMVMPETLGASMPENMRDLELLLSAFTAKPWRNGFSAFVAFIFRTRARLMSPRQSSTNIGASGRNSLSNNSVSSGVDVEAHVRVVVGGADRKGAAAAAGKDQPPAKPDDAARNSSS